MEVEVSVDDIVRVGEAIEDLIPYGKLSCYESLGERIRPKLNARQVAKACSGIGESHTAEEVPYHRVIRKNGYLSKYFSGGGQKKHIKLLEQEGHEIRRSGGKYKVVDFEDYLQEPRY